jgi:hypothetical protein
MRQTIRSLICTIAAFVGGGFGAFTGSKLVSSNQIQDCSTQPWGVSALCSAVAAPGAFVQGGLAGGWTGTILAAFAAGTITSPRRDNAANRLSVPEFQAWLAAASDREPQLSLKLTEEQAAAWLSEVGFSPTTIQQAKEVTLPALKEPST